MRDLKVSMGFNSLKWLNFGWFGVNPILGNLHIPTLSSEFKFLFYFLHDFLKMECFFFFRPGFFATPQPLAKVVRVVWTINDYHLRMFVYHWNAQRNTSTDPNKSPTKCNPFKHMKATLVYPNLHTYNPLKPKTYPFNGWGSPWLATMPRRASSACESLWRGQV